MTRRDLLNLVAAAPQVLETWRRSGRTWVRIWSSLTLDLSAEITQSS